MPRRQIHKLAFARAGLLRQQVLVAQSAGVLMITLPSVVLGGAFYQHARAALLVTVVTVLSLALVYIRVGSRLDSVSLLNRLRCWLGALVLFDLIVIIGLIGLSGGLAHSHLTFVLALIPPILALIRGGGATVLGVCSATAIFALLDILAEHLVLPGMKPTRWFASLLSTTLGLTADDPTAIATYPIATSLGILTGALLALMQSYFASGDTLPEDALYRVTEKHRNGLDDTLEHARLLNVLARSYHKTSRIISLTNHPEIHSSLVHPIDDLVFEAYALALPVYHSRGLKGVSLMSNMVFAVHWLDDLFDGMGYHSILQAGQQGAQVNFSRLSLDDVCTSLRPHGVERVVKLIRGSLSPLQSLSFAKPSWPLGVESGLMRVILAGVIQAADDNVWREEAVRRLRHDIQQLVEDDELDRLIGRVSPAFLWSISKTDMPLVLAMFTNPYATPHLGSIALVLDALLMPLLLWHDLDEEVRREAVGQRQFHTGATLAADLEAAVVDATDILTRKVGILTASELWTHMKPMVAKIASEFGNRIPASKPYFDYTAILNDVLR